MLKTGDRVKVVNVNSDFYNRQGTITGVDSDPILNVAVKIDGCEYTSELQKIIAAYLGVDGVPFDEEELQLLD